MAFWDGSLDAHACVVYARAVVQSPWGDQSTVETNLLYAKNRVAPLEGSTIAKMEIQGLVQATRSLLKLVCSLDQKIDRVVLSGDSMCSIMMARQDGASLKVYFQNRVAEITQNLRAISARVGYMEPISKIAGVQNPADVATVQG